MNYNSFVHSQMILSIAFLFIKYLFAQLNGFNYYYLILIILFKINDLFAHH